jgi:hypothetical protein
MDHLDEHLASVATSPKYGKAIKAAIVLGKKTLNRYYDHTDQSEVYRITMSMLTVFPSRFSILLTLNSSITSLLKAYVFPLGWVARRMDCHHKKIVMQ